MPDQKNLNESSTKSAKNARPEAKSDKQPGGTTKPDLKADCT